MKLKNKVAIVTGSGRSIGRVLALALAKQGANVVIVARNKQEIENVKEEIILTGVKSLAIKADLTNERDVRLMVDSVMKKFGKIDILVNNAGLITDRILPENERGILDVPSKKWDKIIEVNLKTAFLCSQKIGTVMKSQGYGKIINISSNLVKQPTKLFGPYSCAKAGLEMFTKILALELGDYNIQVNSLSPSNSVNITQREFGNNLINRTSPEKLVAPLMKICNSKVTGKSITVK